MKRSAQEFIDGLLESGVPKGEILPVVFADALESALLEKLCGEPAAWLVEEGRTFRDKVFIGEWQANNSIAERNDGARKTALYALNRSKA